MVLHIHDLGLGAIAAIRKRCVSFLKIGEEEGFLWLDELLAECKREFIKPGIALLPKTPSAKRSRRKKREVSEGDDDFQPFQPASKRSRSKAGDELSADSLEACRPTDKTRRTRANSRTESVPSQTRTTRQTRNTRSQKPEMPGSPKPTASLVKNLENEMRSEPSPSVARSNTSHIDSHKTVNIQSPLNRSVAQKSPARSPRNFSVKCRVNAYEDLMKSASPKPSPSRLIVSPVLESENVCEMTSSGGASLMKNLASDAITKSTISTETPKCIRRSSRASIRKSLKMLPSKSRLSGFNSQYQIIVTEQLISEPQTADLSPIDMTSEEAECIDSPVIKLTEEKVKKARTRLRLKKKDVLNEETDETGEPGAEITDQQIETDSRVNGSVSEPEHKLSCSSTGAEIISRPGTKASCSSVSDNSDQPVRSTRTKSRIKENSENYRNENKLQNYIVKSSNESDQPLDTLKQTKPSRTKSRKKAVDNSHLQLTEYESSSENERPVRSTRTKTRKNVNLRISTESEADEDKKPTRPTRTKTRKNSAMSERNSQLSTESEDEKQTSRTRTKTRKPASSRSSVKSGQTKTVSRSDYEDNSKMIIDSGIQSVKTSVASSSDNSDTCFNICTANSFTEKSNEPDGSFAVPTSPAPRTTRTKSRKRQMDEADSTFSKAKRSCSDEIQHEIVGIQNLSSQYSSSSDKDEMEVDQSTDDDTFNCKTPSPLCAIDKVVKTHSASFLNYLNKNKMTPLGRMTPFGGHVTPGNMRFTPLGFSGNLVKSFIKRDTPQKKVTAKELQERRRCELEEKQKKEKERLQRRDILLKMRIEEQRKKREERAKRVQEQKEQHIKRDQAQWSMMAKKLEEKQQSSSVMKEEKMKEEKEKQKQRTKKMLEVEDRRKQEEDERFKKLQDQEVELKRYQETLQRKKDFEEQERQKKVVEEKRKQEERYLEKEKERQEREKQLLLEEEKRRIELQMQKEEKERRLAHERADREHQEQEKRIQRQQAIQLEMEKLDEMEKSRIQKMHEYEEKRKNIVQINSSLNMQNSILINNSTNKPLMNGTITLNTSADQKPINPDSYEMTPKRKHKPSSCENYDISQIQSDDSTDDEDAPRKRLPPWAVGAQLKASLITQHYHPPDLDTLFGIVEPPDLNEFFVKKKPRFNKRTSSAQWDSPLIKPRTTPEPMITSW